MPKTGTTSIQQYLHDNRPLLRQRGYVVPVCPGRTSHRNLTVYALPDDSDATVRRAKGLTSIDAKKRFRKSFYAKLAKEARGWGVNEGVVLTGEHMVILNQKEAFDRLKELQAVIGERTVQVNRLSEKTGRVLSEPVLAVHQEWRLGALVSAGR